MGQKVHPVGFRLGTSRTWDSNWFAQKEYANNVAEDVRVRSFINTQLNDSKAKAGPAAPVDANIHAWVHHKLVDLKDGSGSRGNTKVNAGVSKIEVERTSQQLTVTVSTARPGVVIGKSGSAVEVYRQGLEKLTGKRVRLNVLEIRQAELDATLVARNIAEQLEKRVAFRRAMKQSVQRTMRAGAKGIRVLVSGRLGGNEIASRSKEIAGSVPLQTLRAYIDYGLAEAKTTFGMIGVKVWIYRGDVLPGKDGPEPNAIPAGQPRPRAAGRFDRARPTGRSGRAQTVSRGPAPAEGAPDVPAEQPER